MADLNRFKKIGPALLVIGAGIIFYNLPTASASPLEEAKSIADACGDVTGDRVEHEKCVAKGFATAGEKHGVDFIEKVLTAYQSINTGYQSYQNCHVLAHRIMNDLASREPGKWKKLIGELSPEQLDPTRCGGGFMHGILEVRAGEDPDFKVNAGLFDDICRDSVPVESSTSCAHILGHLALIEAYGSLEEAFKSCDGLSGEFLFQCYGGIFMEDSMRTNLEVHGIAELPTRNLEWFETQLARCKRYESQPEVANGCWYDLPEVFAQTHNYDLKKTYDFCATAPSQGAYDHCYIRASYLVALVPPNLFKDFYAAELCSAYLPEDERHMRCAQGVVGAPLSGSLQLLPRTLAFCAQRPQGVKSQCYDSIVRHIKHAKLSAEEEGRLCNQLPEEAKQTCL